MPPSPKKAFPDRRYTIDDVVDGGDQIVHRLTARGTMKGEFGGMPATGKHATWTEIHIGRVFNGRLTEHAYPDRSSGQLSAVRALC